MNIICKIFGHKMRYTEFSEKGICSPKKCDRCSHLEAGITWPRCPSMPKIKRKKLKYGVIAQHSNGEFSREVNAALDAGWQLQGGVAVNQEGMVITFLQALVKTEFIDIEGEEEKDPENT